MQNKKGKLFLILMVGVASLWVNAASEDLMKYKTNVMMLGLGFTAKSFCSCLFVSEAGEKQCREFASIKQVSPRLTVNFDEKSVTSSLFFIFSRKALFKQNGCILL